MMRMLFAAIRVVSLVVLSGCCLTMAGCWTPPIYLGAAPIPKYRAPPLAYFVKPDMTREERLRDLVACGNRRDLGYNFSDADIKKASNDSKELGPNGMPIGYFILRSRLDACMTSKGYQKLKFGTCEGDDPKIAERCMYP